MTLEQALDKAFGTPTPKQELFYRTQNRYVGYGGARGGGKSHAVRGKSTFLALRYPGIKILVVRRTVGDLRRNYIRPLLVAYSYFPEEARPIYRESEKIFYFPNGSYIEMGYCDTDEDANHYRGNEWDALFLDEATELTEYQYGILNSCVRGVNSFPKRTYLTCNPGGIGHDNVKRLFITRQYRAEEVPKDYSFIQAHVWDNTPLLMSDAGFKRALNKYKRVHKPKVVDEKVIKECMYHSDYIRTLANLPEKIREAMLWGDWDIFSGRFFPEWNPDVHVVEPFRIPSHWRKTAAIDFGLDRFAVLWIAVDEIGNAYCYRNFEESNLVVASAARAFLEHSRNPDGSDENIEMVIAPPDLWNRRNDTGRSAADIFMEDFDIPLVKSGNRREDGWLNVKEYLRYERNEDDNGKIVTTRPKMVFFNTCKWVQEFIPKLQFDIKKPNDVTKEPHEYTHTPDAMRYWCSVHQLSASPIAPPKKSDPFNLDKHEYDGFGDLKENEWENYLVGGF